VRVRSEGISAYGADVLDDADCLVSHVAAGLGAFQRHVRPEIAAADGGAADANDGVGRLDQASVGNVLDTNVAGAEHNCCTLAGFFAACYQASMLREEQRPVVFRAILAEPALFDPGRRPPEDLQQLAFPRSLSIRGSSGGSRWPPTRSAPSSGYGGTGREACGYGACSTRAPVG
jgi:hypothetical protein